MSEISGGEVIVRMLQAEGVRKVFGIIDGTYFGLYASLRTHGIDLITPRHETSAVHMAGAYARLTGKLGVCIASNGPGVANALPGIAVEQAEGNRVLVITACRRPGIAYPDRGGSYQYFDQSGVIGKMAKSSCVISSFERIPELVRMALRKSWEGRPGVVHIDVPENIMNTKVEAEPTLWSPHQYRRTAPTMPPPELVERAADMLIAAEQPLIHAGSGIIHAAAYSELRQVAELLCAPVTTSWSARGVLPETSDLSLPMIHTELNRTARNDADLVLALGTRLGETDWWGKAPYWGHPSKQKMIQVDSDGEMLGLNKPADLAILGDVRLFLAAVAVRLEAKKAEIRTETRRTNIESYNQTKRRDREEWNQALADRSVPMNPAHVASVCGEFFADNAILVVDGGNTTLWANFYHEVRVPNTLLSTFKFGMLGAGVAQALGAAVALPEREVVCIIGDGAMGFHPQEIETAVRNNLKVIYLVLCDKAWGMVKISQSFTLDPNRTLLLKSLPPEENIGTDLGEIEFDKLAMAMGAHGERVSDPKDLKPALERCRASGRCAVIHVDVNPVTHMWAPGLMQFKDMHQEPEGK